MSASIFQHDLTRLRTLANAFGIKTDGIPKSTAKPKLTKAQKDKQEEGLREAAVFQLQQLQKLVGQAANVGPAATPETRGKQSEETASATKAMKDALDRARKPGG